MAAVEHEAHGVTGGGDADRPCETGRKAQISETSREGLTGNCTPPPRSHQIQRCRLPHQISRRNFSSTLRHAPHPWHIIGVTTTPTPTQSRPSLRRKLVDLGTCHDCASSAPTDTMEEGQSIEGENSDGARRSKGGRMKRPGTNGGSSSIASAPWQDYPKREEEEENKA